LKTVSIDKKYMNICLQLAKQGMRSVAPNPMVGSVIVFNDKIIGEGYHKEYGKAHAEVNAINAVEDKSLLQKCTLYVNLEPCAHFGKTPPCSDLIIKHKIPKVVIGCIDSFSEVAGKGIAKMKAEGIEVIVGVLESESLNLNKRFFTFHNKKRPYIILKWAQTLDGFIDVERNNLLSSEIKNNWITSPESKELVHKWRSKEQAIMVGTNTALNDNPQLNVREVNGKDPIRVVLDLNLRLPKTLHVFDKSIPTLIFNSQKNESQNNLEFVKINIEKDLIAQVLNELFVREIQSVIIEGGAKLLTTFIDENLWDEARVFTGSKEFNTGLKAPILNNTPQYEKQVGTDILKVYFND